ncbi:MAG: hypothetical protein HY908_37645 [Myxococcales bacterium]|nr:hypothetical protein [Myxococcales bacterium]
MASRALRRGRAAVERLGTPDGECPGKLVCSGQGRACIEWQGVLPEEPWPK